MDWVFDFAVLAILFPIVGLLINAFLGRRLGARGSGLVACLAAGLAFIVSVLTLVALLESENHAAREVERVLYDWAMVGELHLPIALRLDPLSVTMMLVVSGVGSLIHVYAVGYMHDDPRCQRCLVYFNLCLASMLVLVMANNYGLMFVGWELVGLGSYLLIGFWFEGVDNAMAGKKALVVNRVGDWGFMLGILLITVAFGSLEFTDVFDQVGRADNLSLWGTTFTMKEVVTAITLLLLVGATAKSAQIPLLVWLPDATTGPAPASALLYAATTVTAGIYMITRNAPLYELATFSADLLAIVGGLTALLAATSAVAQSDIQRVLAYSTVSQLGFMVAAVGLGGYVAGMLHLVTHAFFKALLFLGAGSVIHGMGHAKRANYTQHPGTNAPHPDNPQDMRNMGGLGRRMRWTFATYVVGWLALVGLFPLSGFWSKGAILAEAWEHNSAVWALLSLAAFLSAFYMTRQVILVFGGEPRTPAAIRVHESRNLMVVPLVVLATLSILGGALNLPVARFLEHHAADFNIGVASGLTVIVALGIFFAWAVYSRGRIDAYAPDRLAGLPGNLFSYMNRGWRVDELYHQLFVKPYYWLADRLALAVDWQFWHDFVHDNVLAEPFRATAAFLANPIDRGFVDGIVNRLAKLIQSGSGELRQVQTGYVRNYALSILLGVVVVVAWLVLKKWG